ncbi:CHRD domain-containing protein [Aegicerativicinus sediminis]|uniref:CHRD domain-containing protein n=1 Tax=Aegicerativicinus sediminis TaxID=2893202 RepID=UPI001E5BCC97|nr:CHRD domain-containing protein [Aegicerativicinus sediminis]
MQILKQFLTFGFISMFILTTSCNNDDDNMDEPPFMGDSKVFQLYAKSNPSISGTATFMQQRDGSTEVQINLMGVSSGTHPSHIHFNSAAEGGDIAITLDPVDASGMSLTMISALDDGSPILYNDLIQFDGYINVHLSASDLATLIAQGDIGTNELTSTTKTYDLMSKDVDGIMGTATFTERVDGKTLATIMLEETTDGGMHPGHIHNNTAAEGGGIAISFTPVNGTTGMSMTSIEMLDDGTPITYDELLDYNGYINIHLSANDLGTLVAQGDIGQNELTAESKTYDLMSKDVEGIMGTATFTERVNGTALATIMLEGTPDEGMHPAHIHNNTAAEGGGIAITFTPIDGTTGMSMTQIGMLDDGTAISYDDLLMYDGYINVHLSAEDLGTLVAQGDIGQNELTGTMDSYALSSVANAAISGTATFMERLNGETLVKIELDGTTTGMTHPAHIHTGSVANAPGAIAISLTSVDGGSGISYTNVSQLDSGTAIDYTAMTSIDGYINVHLAAEQLDILIAQGNVGANAN